MGLHWAPGLRDQGAATAAIGIWRPDVAVGFEGDETSRRKAERRRQTLLARLRSASAMITTDEQEREKREDTGERAA